MNITYIFHSGFLIETSECYYIFDYWKGDLPTLDTSKPVFVFASHCHADHYNPEIFTLLRSRGMRQITAVLARDIPQKRWPAFLQPAGSIPVVKACHSTEYDLPFHTRVQTLLSTDSGVAYLVSCPEGTIFHAGDLNEWNSPDTPEQERRQMTGSYRAAVNKLKGKAIDVAFLPLDPRLKGGYANGFLYFIKNINVKQVFPMHYWEQPEIIGQFRAEFPQFKETVKDTEQQKPVL